MTLVYTAVVPVPTGGSVTGTGATPRASCDDAFRHMSGTSAYTGDGWAGTDGLTWYMHPGVMGAGTWGTDSALCVFEYRTGGVPVDWASGTITSAESSGGGGTGGTGGTGAATITCSVSPCEVSVSLAIAPTAPASDPGFGERVEQEALAWSALLLVLGVVACWRGLLNIVNRSANEA